MDADGRHCETEEKQLHRANVVGCTALLERLRIFHGGQTEGTPEPDLVDLVPAVTRRTQVQQKNQSEARFIRYLTDEVGKKFPTVAEIKHVVATHFDVTPVNLDSRSRKANFVWPRQLAMYLCHVMTVRSLPDIGRRFGGRDHTTALHAIRKIEKMVAENPAICDLVRELREQIG